MDLLSKCVLCGSGNGSFNPYCRKGKYQIVRCGQCGLIFVNPRDDRDQLAKQYEDDLSSPISYYQGSAAVDSLIFNRRLNWIEKIIPKGGLLDIGCNVGTFMDLAKGRGWNVTGIDVNKKAFEFCSQKGLDVHSGLFDQDRVRSLKGKTFDVVCIHDVVEHFPNPLESMSLVRSVIRNQGYLAMNTPNISNVLTKIFQIKPKEHIFYFNKETAVRLLRQSGFEVIFIKKAGRKRDFSALQTGVTLESKLWCKICRFLHVTGLGLFANFILENFFTDELFIIAKKS